MGPKWAQGPQNCCFLDFYKLVDLEISCQGPWLKNSEPSYVSSYGPGQFSHFGPLPGPNQDWGHVHPGPRTRRTLFFGKTYDNFREMIRYSGGVIPPSEYQNISRKCSDILGGSIRNQVLPIGWTTGSSHTPPEYPDIPGKCPHILGGGTTPQNIRTFPRKSSAFSKK